MGVFDFVKNVGKKLGFGDDEAPEAEAVKKEFDSHALGTGKVEVAVKDDRCVLKGVVADQATFEKAVVAVGDTLGISRVDADGLKVVAPDSGLKLDGNVDIDDAGEGVDPGKGAGLLHGQERRQSVEDRGDELRQGQGVEIQADLRGQQADAEASRQIYPGQVLRIPISQTPDAQRRGRRPVRPTTFRSPPDASSSPRRPPHPILSRSRCPGGAGRGHPQCRAGGATLRACHAEDRQADERAHDQLRHARLGDRPRARLSLPAHPSGHRLSRGRRSRAAARALERPSSGWPHPPEACLVNFYSEDARMGLHQDRDEQDLPPPSSRCRSATICLFRVGGTKRDDRTLSFKLQSGDIVVLGGEARLCFHGVDRIYPMTSTLLRWRPHQPDAQAGDDLTASRPKRRCSTSTRIERAADVG